MRRAGAQLVLDCSGSEVGLRGKLEGVVKAESFIGRVVLSTGVLSIRVLGKESSLGKG